MKTIVIIGAGRVATTLGRRLSRVARPVQVYSRTLSHARTLADDLGCEATDDPARLIVDADYYMVAVNDDAIAAVVDATPATAGVWFHTAGSCSIDVFKGKRARYGVLYPLISFTGHDDPAETPLYLEAAGDEVLSALTSLASGVGTIAGVITSEQRRRLHLAAVMTCNFTSHIWALAHDLLPSGSSFAAMMPLVRQLLSRVEGGAEPVDIQTGPARRGDLMTMDTHASMLAGTARDVYTLLSRSIGEMYHTDAEASLYGRVRGIVFDIDGVLSPSTITVSPAGEPLRGVNVKDGYAIQLAAKLGLPMAIISGARVEAIRPSCEAMGLHAVYLGVSDKLPVLRQWAQSQGLSLDNVAMVGDDVPDIPAMRAVGMAVAPEDAAAEVRAVARLVVPVKGGYGVARYLIERVLRARGQWMDEAHAFGW